jgi:hypothetical protein
MRLSEESKPKATPVIDNKAPSVSADTKAAMPSQQELGLSGTVNWNGQIYSEANSKLQWHKAYGTPGSTEWGEWEKLDRTDEKVSSALNMLAAPIRDADIEICLPEEYEEALKEKPDQLGVSGADKGKDSEERPKPNNPQQPPSELADVDEEPKEEDDNAESRQIEQDSALKVEAEKLKVICEFVKDNLQKWLEPKWPTLLEQIIHYGTGYGFSLHEIVWGTREDERVAGGTAFYIKKLSQRLPSSIKQNGWVEKNGELALIRQSGLKDGVWKETIELPADKVLLATWNRSGNNYQGFSAFRPIWYLAQVRAELLRIMAIGSQRESLGVPVATMEKDVALSVEQRNALQELLENVVYHENAGFQLPPGVNLEWFFSPSSNKSHLLEMWKQLGIAILELVQVQQIALGTGDTGSRAVGEVHDDTKNSFIRGLCAWIESVVNGVGEQPYTGLIKKIVDLNFGPQKVYPELKFVVQQSELDSMSFANAIKTLVDAGAINLTEKDENKIRERIGLSPIDSLERAQMEEQKKQEQAEKLEAMKQGMGQKPAEPEEKSLSELLGL